MGNKNSNNTTYTAISQKDNGDMVIDIKKIKEIIDAKSFDKFNEYFSSIRSYANTNQKDENGQTILHLLCAKSKNNDINKMIVKLLEKCSNMNINIQTSFGNTPLHICADNYPILCKLIEYGADIHLKNENGYTPLMRFFRTKMYNILDKRCVFTLCDLGADVNDRHIIMTICQDWDKNDILKFLEYCPNLNIIYDNETPLSSIIKRFTDDKEFIKTFISKNVNINLSGPKNGNTILLVNVANQCWNYVDILLENGADPNVTNIKGKNVGYYCRDYRDLDKFVYYGYDIVSNGIKLLEHYCSQGEKYHNIVLYLLEHNVVIDERNYILRTHPIVREFNIKKN